MTYRMREEGKADVFDYIERFYNLQRRYLTIGYLKSGRVRKVGAVSLGWCQPNRQQASAANRIRR